MPMGRVMVAIVRSIPVKRVRLFSVKFKYLKTKMMERL